MTSNINIQGGKKIKIGTSQIETRGGKTICIKAEEINENHNIHSIQCSVLR
jgi:hypothetical protein